MSPGTWTLRGLLVLCVFFCVRTAEARFCVARTEGISTKATETEPSSSDQTRTKATKAAPPEKKGAAAPLLDLIQQCYDAKAAADSAAGGADKTWEIPLIEDPVATEKCKSHGGRALVVYHHEPTSTGTRRWVQCIPDAAGPKTGLKQTEDPATPQQCPTGGKHIEICVTKPSDHQCDPAAGRVAFDICAPERGPPGPEGRAGRDADPPRDPWHGRLLYLIPAAAAGGGEAFSVPRPGDPSAVRIRGNSLIGRASGPFGVAIGVHPFRLYQVMREQWLQSTGRAEEWAPWYLNDQIRLIESTAAAAKEGTEKDTPAAANGDSKVAVAGKPPHALLPEDSGGRHYSSGLLDGIELSFGSLMDQYALNTERARNRYSFSLTLDVLEIGKTDDKTWYTLGGGTHEFSKCIQESAWKEHSAKMSRSNAGEDGKKGPEENYDDPSVLPVIRNVEPCRAKSQPILVTGVGGALAWEDRGELPTSLGGKGWVAFDFRFETGGRGNPVTSPHKFTTTLALGASTIVQNTRVAGSEPFYAGLQLGYKPFDWLGISHEAAYERSVFKAAGGIDIALPAGLVLSPGLRYMWNPETRQDDLAGFVNVGWSHVPTSFAPVDWLRDEPAFAERLVHLMSTVLPGCRADQAKEDEKTNNDDKKTKSCNSLRDLWNRGLGRYLSDKDALDACKALKQHFPTAVPTGCDETPTEQASSPPPKKD